MCGIILWDYYTLHLFFQDSNWVHENFHCNCAFVLIVVYLLCVRSIRSHKGREVKTGRKWHGHGYSHCQCLGGKRFIRCFTSVIKFFNSINNDMNNYPLCKGVNWCCRIQWIVPNHVAQKGHWVRIQTHILDWTGCATSVSWWHRTVEMHQSSLSLPGSRYLRHPTNWFRLRGVQNILQTVL